MKVTVTDDGVRLWVNGQLIVDAWVDQPATEWSGSVASAAGHKYSITMEYYENAGDASAQLSWSSPSTVKAVIPQTQLYSTFAPWLNTNASAFTGGRFQMQPFGLPGNDYVLQATTHFGGWTPIATNFSPAAPGVTLPASLFNFTDPAATNFPNRFCRARQLR